MSTKRNSTDAKRDSNRSPSPGKDLPALPKKHAPTLPVQLIAPSKKGPGSRETSKGEKSAAPTSEIETAEERQMRKESIKKADSLVAEEQARLTNEDTKELYLEQLRRKSSQKAANAESEIERKRRISESQKADLNEEFLQKRNQQLANSLEEQELKRRSQNGDPLQQAKTRAKEPSVVQMHQEVVFEANLRSAARDIPDTEAPVKEFVKDPRESFRMINADREKLARKRSLSKDTLEEEQAREESAKLAAKMIHEEQIERVTEQTKAIAISEAIRKKNIEKADRWEQQEQQRRISDSATREQEIQKDPVMRRTSQRKSQVEKELLDLKQKIASETSIKQGANKQTESSMAIQPYGGNEIAVIADAKQTIQHYGGNEVAIIAKGKDSMQVFKKQSTVAVPATSQNSQNDDKKSQKRPSKP